MPVVFEPAQPVGEQIAAQYGATEQFNRMAPHIMQANQSNLNRAAASQAQQLDAQVRTNIASAHNMTEASLAGSAMENQRYMQEQGLMAARAAQERQIQSRQQEIVLDAAMYEQKVTQAEVMRMQRQQVALDALQEASRPGGPLLPEEAAEMKASLLTGINMTQQRMQRDHARDFAAQAQLREEQAKVAAINTETIKGLSLAAAQKQTSTGMLINPITGTPHWVRVDDKGNIVPVEDKKAGEEKPSPQNEWGHLAKKGTNKLDEAAAQKDALAWAKFHTPPVYREKKDAQGNTSQEMDKAATDAAIRKTAVERLDGIKREFSQAEGGGKVAAEGGGFSNEIKALEASGNEIVADFGKRAIGQIREIVAKGPYQSLSPEDKEKLATLRQFLQGQLDFVQRQKQR